jgi:hypothetical protein
VLTIGRRPRVDWTLLRAYSLQKYFFKSFSFILVLVSLVIFKQLSYSLLFQNFRWLVLAAQPRKSTRRQPTGQLAPRNVPPQQELQHDSPQEEEPFEIVVVAPKRQEPQGAPVEGP